MDRRTRLIDLNDVERAIGEGFRCLRFSPQIERRFQDDVGDGRCKSMIRQNYIALIVYHSFLYGDYRSIGDVFYLDVFVHFLIMTPVVLMVNAALARRPPVWLREGLETLGVAILASSIVVVACASRYPDRDMVLLCLALVVLFVIVMQRIQFWFVMMGCISIQFLYLVGTFLIGEMSLERAIISNSLVLGIIIFSLIGAYNLEYEQRLGYLLRLRDLFRNRQLELASLRDALTGVGNRRALDLALTALSARSGAGSSSPTAVLLLDIDHFKRFNDTNGHQEGDACLRRVAALIAATLCSGAQVAYRFGGEEFLVLLEDAGFDEAVAVAERIRSTVARARIPQDPTAAAVVTISIGVASGHLGRDTTSEALVAAADAALYAAKREGRNRVSLAA